MTYVQRRDVTILKVARVRVPGVHPIREVASAATVRFFADRSTCCQVHKEQSAIKLVPPFLDNLIHRSSVLLQFTTEGHFFIK